jgi:hypothetical protein
MKRLTNRFFLITVFVLAATATQAQIGVHFGATTAINATFVFDKGLTEDPRYDKPEMTYKMAPIGFNFGVDLGRKFGLSLESILSKQGQIYKIIDAAEQIKGQRKIDMSLLQLPMLLRFMSGGNGGARANFNFGPQLSIIRDAVESVQAQMGTYQLPDGMDFSAVQAEYGAANVQNNGDGTYDIIQNVPSKDVLSKKLDSFKNSEFAIAGSFGLDIDLSKHLYLTSQIRATYSLTDMRNGDVIEQIKDGGNPFGNRANLAVGIQLGLHYSIGTTRSFKFKE